MKQTFANALATISASPCNFGSARSMPSCFFTIQRYSGRPRHVTWGFSRTWPIQVHPALFWSASPLRVGLVRALLFPTHLFVDLATLGNFFTFIQRCFGRHRHATLVHALLFFSPSSAILVGLAMSLWVSVAHDPSKSRSAGLAMPLWVSVAQDPSNSHLASPLPAATAATAPGAAAAPGGKRKLTSSFSPAWKPLFLDLETLVLKP